MFISLIGIYHRTCQLVSHNIVRPSVIQSGLRFNQSTKSKYFQISILSVAFDSSERETDTKGESIDKCYLFLCLWRRTNAVRGQRDFNCKLWYDDTTMTTLPTRCEGSPGVKFSHLNDTELLFKDLLSWYVKRVDSGPQIVSKSMNGYLLLNEVTSETYLTLLTERLFVYIRQRFSCVLNPLLIKLKIVYPNIHTHACVTYGHFVGFN